MKFKTLDEAIKYAEQHHLSANGYSIKPVDGGWMLIKGDKA